MAGSLWVRLVKKNRIARDDTEPCAREDWQDALTAVCHRLDIARPIVMPRHERDWETFSQTRFLREHFMEHVDFERMEIEYIDPEAKKKKSQDVRNG